MDSRLAIAEEIYKDYTAHDVCRNSERRTINHIANAYHMSPTAVRAYIFVAKLPIEIKEWIDGDYDIPRLSFYTAAESSRRLGRHAHTVLLSAMKLLLDRSAEGMTLPLRATHKFLIGVAEDIGVSFEEIEDSVIDPTGVHPIESSKKIHSDVYAQEWCMTLMTKLLVEELSQNIIDGVPDEKTNSFYVKMPLRYGLEMRRLMSILLANGSANGNYGGWGDGA